MTDPLQRRAELFGIRASYHGISGELFHPPHEALTSLLTAFGIPIEGTDPEARPPELYAPEGVRCFLPESDARMWGVAVQLYQLRSARNWGIGDFQDLAELAQLCGDAGADFIGLNPLHALFLAVPQQCSPFSPSNRRFLNPLYIAVNRVPGFTTPPDLTAVRDGDLVDYAGVTEVKMAALRDIWARGVDDPEGFSRFMVEGGELLRRHALFEALSLHFGPIHGAGWQGWPEEWRDVESPAVARFAAENASEVEFHIWLQWLADRQLAEVRDACHAAGMRIGLYLDFAVGESPGGSGTWSDPGLVVSGARIGASPDWFNAAGQDWGLAPLSPVELAARHAAPFQSLMQDATHRAGALRLDHAMSLWQLFLIPDGMTAPQGTYVRYPVQDMIAALAQASNENRTIIIGEDLGNVPDGFREVMAAANILSYRILLFERHYDGFISPEHYPREALVCVSTHDLPTFQGWWRGDDVGLRLGFGFISPESAEQQAGSRVHERRQLLGDLIRGGLLDPSASETPIDAAPEELVIATHRHLARTPSRLLAVRLEDIAGEVAPVNVPSTVDEHPNWRRKLSISLEDLPGTSLFRGITQALAAERPRT